MIRFIKPVAVIMFLAFVACNNTKDVKKITVSGIVIDSTTGRPIARAKVTLLCWRKINYDELTYDKIDTIANDRGAFTAEFRKCLKVDIGSVSSGYHPTVIELDDLDQTPDIKLVLKVDNSKGIIKDLGQLAVFVREYNTNSPKAREYYGINLLDGRNTQSLDSIDITIEQNEKNVFPKVLVTAQTGGIVPIFRGSNQSIDKAPASGYQKKYQLVGNEQGFFIKCRDGKSSARLMMFGLEYDRSSPYQGSSFKDHGIMFNVELQTIGNEFGNPTNLRLDHYILEHV